MVRFAWYLTRLDTFKVHENAPQNHLQNGWAIVELSEFVIGVFCLMLTICSVTYYGPFCVIVDLFGYLHTLWRCSIKLLTKQVSCCGGKWTCILCFLPSPHHLLSTFLWTVSHGCGPNWISTHSLKMLHTTFYKTVIFLFRYVKSYFQLFAWLQYFNTVSNMSTSNRVIGDPCWNLIQGADNPWCTS